MLASRPCIIKVSPKSDMAIIWINIWNVQNGNKVKKLINKYFNIGSYIATIRNVNMNPGRFQCKNCWKLSHMTFSCRSQGAKCVKYNGPYKSKYHWHFAWYCKANSKTNPPRLKTKQDELYSHSFRCLNCWGNWGNHQVDSNQYLFWKHRFNYEYYAKKYQELYVNRKQLLCSTMNSSKAWLWRISRYFLKMFTRTIS